ncbi:hypothetical protein D3C71_1841680 [compost metagenome]
MARQENAARADQALVGATTGHAGDEPGFELAQAARQFVFAALGQDIIDVLAFVPIVHVDQQRADVQRGQDLRQAPGRGQPRALP